MELAFAGRQRPREDYDGEMLNEKQMVQDPEAFTATVINSWVKGVDGAH